ncbi:MAG TPA: fibronectin type III domain-containing protein, partial [Castellaniella sp.]|nr:fibronectin type III domain-containing protein [Castellaniella sp.]
HHAPEDGAVGAALPYSYGYKDPVNGFRTIMAHPCVGVDCPRIPNFSNPSVLHEAHVTGSSRQNNALSINTAAFTVASWRQAFAATPPAPTGVVTQVKGTLVTAAWDPVHPSAGVTSYLLQVGSTPGARDLMDAPVGNTTSVSGHATAGTFYWRVVAINESGPGQPSSEAKFTVGGPCSSPGPPQDLIIWLDGRTVNFRWSAPVTGSAVTNYILEAGTLPGSVNIYNGSTGSVRTRASAPAPPGIYFTRLRAQNECGVSEPTPEQLIVVR